MTTKPEEKKCCVMCRESLQDNFCCAPTCKCHSSPEIPEWEKRLKTQTNKASAFLDFCPVVHRENVDEIITMVRNQTLEEACDAISGIELFDAREVKSTIRSLKK